MFVILLMMTTLLVLVTANSMFSWIMMEFNMLVFTPLMCPNKSTTEADTSIKYLIPQSFASGLFMMALIMTSYWSHSNILSSAALLMKVGSAPFHSWFPLVMASINLISGFLLTTWQKIIPLSLMSIPQLSSSSLILVSAAMTALWGSIAGLNQTNMMSLLAFSSIAHLSWLTSASILNLQVSLLYFMFYSITLFPIFWVMYHYNTKTHKAFMSSKSMTYFQAIITTNFLSLAGMPPLAMFSSKIPIIILMQETLTILVLMLVSAVISLYFYIAIIFTILLNLETLLITSKKQNYLKSICILSFMLQLHALPLTLCFFT